MTWNKLSGGTGTDPNTHTHTNKASLDRLGVNDSNQLTIDNNPLSGGTGTDPLFGLRWGILGSSSSDSGLAAMTLYHEHIAARTGIVNLEFADYGSTLTGSESGTNQLFRLSQMPTDLDIVTTLCGINDMRSGSTLGTFADRTSSTFYGAYHLLAIRLLDKYPTQPIGFMIGHYRADYTLVHGATQKAYHTAIKEVGEWYGIPVLDLYAESRVSYNYVPNNNANPQIVESDNIHLTTAGNQIISRPIESFLRRLLGK